MNEEEQNKWEWKKEIQQRAKELDTRPKKN